MNILVQNKDLGFWTQERITVQRFERVDEDELALVYCDHAQAEEEEEETLSGYVCQISRCYKCGAVRLVGDNQWQDEPVEGGHNV